MQSERKLNCLPFVHFKGLLFYFFLSLKYRITYVCRGLYICLVIFFICFNKGNLRFLRAVWFPNICLVLVVCMLSDMSGLLVVGLKYLFDQPLLRLFFFYFRLQSCCSENLKCSVYCVLVRYCWITNLLYG